MGVASNGCLDPIGFVSALGFVCRHSFHARACLYQQGASTNGRQRGATVE
jgi:hypothetical protein